MKMGLRVAFFAIRSIILTILQREIVKVRLQNSQSETAKYT